MTLKYKIQNRRQKTVNKLIFFFLSSAQLLLLKSWVKLTLRSKKKNKEKTRLAQTPFYTFFFLFI